MHEVTFGRDLREVMQLRRKEVALESSHELLEWMLRRAQSCSVLLTRMSR